MSDELSDCQYQLRKGNRALKRPETLSEPTEGGREAVAAHRTTRGNDRKAELHSQWFNNHINEAATVSSRVNKKSRCLMLISRNTKFDVREMKLWLAPGGYIMRRNDSPLSMRRRRNFEGQKS